MNYLAHIQLAHITNTSALGNFLGDFVKGSNLAHLSPDIRHGVRLHRAIDSFTDTHPIIRDAKRRFPASIRRMSGVVIDIYFDHLLASRWTQFTRSHMPLVLNAFYSELAHSNIFLGPHFQRVKEGLLSDRWLHEYSNISYVERAFFQIEKRLHHRVEFAQASADFISTIELELQTSFSHFYPELVDYCNERHEELR